MPTTNSTLRGLGRNAYRAGMINPIPYAARWTGRALTSAERAEVLAGWITERTEQVQS